MSSPEAFSLKHDTKNIGLAKLLYRLRQDIDLYRLIGLNVDALKASDLSDALIGHMNLVAQEGITLSICKIYEYEKRNELNSIRGVLNSLKTIQYTDAQKMAIDRFAAKYGNLDPNIGPARQLEGSYTQFKTSHEKSIAQCQTHRDKFIAHSEHDAFLDFLPSHDEFEILFEFANNFYRLISESILDAGPALIGTYVACGFINLMKKYGIEHPKVFFPM